MHPKKSGSPSGKKHKVSNTVKTLEALKESPPSSSPLQTPASKKRTASSSPVSDYKEFKKLDTMSSNEKLMSALNFFFPGSEAEVLIEGALTAHQCYLGAGRLKTRN